MSTEKLQELAALLESQSIEELKKHNRACEANIQNRRTSVKPGKKYTKIDIGGSGRLMVDNITGEIFGIKGYGVIHKGHKYGTLDTINDYFWGGYYPTAKSRPQGTHINERGKE